MTTCCNNPRIVSTAFTDTCESCGWYQSYRGDCEEGHDMSLITNYDDNYEDEDE